MDVMAVGMPAVRAGEKEQAEAALSSVEGGEATQALAKEVKEKLGEAEGATGGAVGLEVWVARAAGPAGRAGPPEREGEPGPCPAEDRGVEPGALERGGTVARVMGGGETGALERGGPVVSPMGEKATVALERGYPVVSSMGEGATGALEEEDLACQLDDRMV